MPDDLAPSGLRILLTCDAVGGVWTYAVGLARGLAAEGHAVTLAVLGPEPAGEQRELARAVSGLSLVATGLPLDWTAPSADAVREAGSALARLAAETGADLVHLHGPALAAGAPFPVPALASCHSCVRTWWDAVRGAAPLPPDLAWRADLVAEGCRAVAALVAPSRAFAQATASAYRLERLPVVVPNGQDAPSLAPAPIGEEVVAFTAGRLWDEGKNVAILDAAAALTRVPIVAAGATRGPNAASATFARLHCSGQLTADAVRQRLAARPIFLSPALYEPFGLSVLEAAGHGCPLVLSDIPTFRELWEGAALLVDPRDPEAWAGAIERLAARPDERNALGRRARAASLRYGLDATLRGTLAVYRRILAGQGASARPGRESRTAA